MSLNSDGTKDLFAAEGGNAVTVHPMGVAYRVVMFGLDKVPQCLLISLGALPSNYIVWLFLQLLRRASVISHEYFISVQQCHSSCIYSQRIIVTV